MEKSIFGRISALGERIMAQKGECIMIVSDGQSDKTQCTIHCHDKASAGALLAQFFDSNPELIPITLHAMAVSMEFNNCQLCDYDDENEESADDDDEFCMN